MDPGSMSDNSAISNIDVMLITHEHEDHCHLASIKEILRKSPNAMVVTHEGVGKILEKEEIGFTRIADGQEILHGGVAIKSYGTDHACIHHDLPNVQNTGFMICNTLFYPGDAFHVPPCKVQTLALPVAAPWMRIEEAVEYAKQIMPKTVFPVHDGMLRPERLGSTRRVPKIILEPLGITYVDMVEGSVAEF